MIPKMIHYCWFGRGEMSQLNKKCIQTWEDVLPDYEIMLWD
ncbi:mannosyltransferase, partial [Klebsiella oxytoca]